MKQVLLVVDPWVSVVLVGSGFEVSTGFGIGFGLKANIVDFGYSNSF